MTEVDLSAVLSSIDVHAERLNKASDNANAVLRSIEQRLVDANIGLEFWWDRPFVQSDEHGDLGPHSTRSWTGTHLGFSKIEGKWSLALKMMRYVEGFYEGQMDCPFTNTFVAAEPSTLLKAPRDLRLAALRVMPEFLLKVSEHLHETVDKIESTTKTLTQ